MFVAVYLTSGLVAMVAGRAVRRLIHGGRPGRQSRLGPRVRLPAGLAGAALVVTGAAGVSVAWIFVGTGAQRPDPGAGAGEPCCDVPDTLGQAAAYVASGVALLLLALGLLWAGDALIRRAFARRTTTL